ncbi:ABC transporter permease [Longirhabdus pacifica]|uniref:ABC transporter permease n=1 Tax=Longirhabdus pacifica TaxID=2305227 RepID=UPI001008A892|nr:ABC transporter permease [Longirhabdus pacifica]
MRHIALISKNELLQVFRSWPLALIIFALPFMLIFIISMTSSVNIMIYEEGYVETKSTMQSTHSGAEPTIASTTNENTLSINEINVEQVTALSPLQYYTASTLVTCILFQGLGAAISIIDERKDKTFTRLRMLPMKTSTILTGKLVGNALICLIQSLWIIMISTLLFQVDWGQHIEILTITCLLTICISMLIALHVTFLFQSVKVIYSFFYTFIIVMTFISGGMIKDLSNQLEFIGSYTVHHWAFKSLLQGMLDYHILEAMYHIIPLMGTAMMLYIIALIGYRKVDFYK